MGCAYNTEQFKIMKPDSVDIWGNKRSRPQLRIQLSLKKQETFCRQSQNVTYK